MHIIYKWCFNLFFWWSTYMQGPDWLDGGPQWSAVYEAACFPSYKPYQVPNQEKKSNLDRLIRSCVMLFNFLLTSSKGANFVVQFLFESVIASQGELCLFSSFMLFTLGSLQNWHWAFEHVQIFTDTCKIFRFQSIFFFFFFFPVSFSSYIKKWRGNMFGIN